MLFHLWVQKKFLNHQLKYIQCIDRQITGVVYCAADWQPGADDATMYVRGVGSLTEGLSSPLVLVDGVERSFNQLDPNEN